MNLSTIANLSISHLFYVHPIFLFYSNNFGFINLVEQDFASTITDLYVLASSHLFILLKQL